MSMVTRNEQGVAVYKLSGHNYTAPELVMRQREDHLEVVRREDGVVVGTTTRALADVDVE